MGGSFGVVAFNFAIYLPSPTACFRLKSPSVITKYRQLPARAFTSRLVVLGTLDNAEDAV